MTDSPKPTTKRKPTSVPTEHKIIVLTSDRASGKLEAIEAQLAVLSAEGWTIHITNVEYTISLLTVHGHATR